MKKKLILSLMVAGALLASVTAVVFAAPGDITDPDVLKQLAGARQATRQYLNAELPTWDGVAGPYVQVSPYVPGMGYHYANFALMDGVVDEASPELLLYADDGNGRRLVGVEYFVPDVGQPTPILFGRPMDGPMPGHGPGEPWHYDLHAWLWEGNPDGIFAIFNPNLP